ncbi:hypothetical protein [Candidatus Amarolinea dominans]|uniref:hypothetical protein n=1 Tax=Candidatus Amarolinea dominans TaxID=3140696 RepID=UPI001DEA6851|nr:hypothetical protein [Anaerolineae bacterium]
MQIGPELRRGQAGVLREDSQGLRQRFNVLPAGDRQPLAPLGHQIAAPLAHSVADIQLHARDR